MRTDDLHVTLAFLAAVPANEADTLIRAVTVAADARPSFAWRLGTLGGFPRADRARVAWLGVDGGADELTRLARAVRSALASAGLPFDERSFRPHLTVARARRAPVRLPDGVGIEAPAARVSELVVVRSDLATRGAEHRVLAHLPLAGSADQSGATSNVKTVSDR